MKPSDQLDHPQPNRDQLDLDTLGLTADDIGAQKSAAAVVLPEQEASKSEVHKKYDAVRERLNKTRVEAAKFKSFHNLNTMMKNYNASPEVTNAIVTFVNGVSDQVVAMADHLEVPVLTSVPANPEFSDTARTKINTALESQVQAVEDLNSSARAIIDKAEKVVGSTALLHRAFSEKVAAKEAERKLEKLELTQDQLQFQEAMLKEVKHYTEALPIDAQTHVALSPKLGIAAEALSHRYGAAIERLTPEGVEKLGKAAGKMAAKYLESELGKAKNATPETVKAYIEQHTNDLPSQIAHGVAEQAKKASSDKNNLPTKNKKEDEHFTDIGILNDDRYRAGKKERASEIIRNINNPKNKGSTSRHHLGGSGKKTIRLTEEQKATAIEVQIKEEKLLREQKYGALNETAFNQVIAGFGSMAKGVTVSSQVEEATKKTRQEIDTIALEVKQSAEKLKSLDIEGKALAVQAAVGLAELEVIEKHRYRDISKAAATYDVARQAVEQKLQEASSLQEKATKSDQEAAQLLGEAKTTLAKAAGAEKLLKERGGLWNERREEVKRHITVMEALDQKIADANNLYAQEVQSAGEKAPKGALQKLVNAFTGSYDKAVKTQQSKALKARDQKVSALCGEKDAEVEKSQNILRVLNEKEQALLVGVDNDLAKLKKNQESEIAKWQDAASIHADKASSTAQTAVAHRTQAELLLAEAETEHRAAHGVYVATTQEIDKVADAKREAVIKTHFVGDVYKVPPSQTVFIAPQIEKNLQIHPITQTVQTLRARSNSVSVAKETESFKKQLDQEKSLITDRAPAAAIVGGSQEAQSLGRTILGGNGKESTHTRKDLSLKDIADPKLEKSFFGRIAEKVRGMFTSKVSSPEATPTSNRASGREHGVM